jgi:thymidylate kinase
MHNLATNSLMPDITFILDVDANISLTRMKQRGIQNAMDSIDINRHNALRQAYLNLTPLFQKRIHLIDASGNDTDTFEKIWNILEF